MKSTFRQLFKKNHPSDAVPQGYVSLYYDPANGGFVTKDDAGNVSKILMDGGAVLPMDASFNDLDVNNLSAQNLSLLQFNEAIMHHDPVALVTQPIEAESGSIHKAILRASTAVAFTLPAAGGASGVSLTVMVQQPAVTGNGTATFTGVKWPAGSAPTVTAAAGKMDIFRFVCDGSNWYGEVAAQNYTP